MICLSRYCKIECVEGSGWRVLKCVLKILARVCPKHSFLPCNRFVKKLSINPHPPLESYQPRWSPLADFSRSLSILSIKTEL